MVYIRRRRAPLWFVVLVAVACAAAWRVLGAGVVPPGGAGDPAAPIALAWFGWILTLVEALWTGVEVAGKVALVVLQYSVTIVWRAVTLLGKGAAELAQYAWKGAKVAWSLFRDTYEHVLKPAWQFFWKWVDRVEQWLQRTFGPVLTWLRRVRAWVLQFYAAYVRPILDLLDISRRALHVLGSLGLEWARRLDARLGAIEDWIDRRFQSVLGAINEIINVVNRVVTADGLFQRLAFVKTLARDVKHAANQFGWGLSSSISAADREALRRVLEAQSLSGVRRNLQQYIRDGSGPDAELLSSVSADVRALLRAP
jgi:hypothetical protein